MARVFEAMQKFGASNASEEHYASSFLQFYNFSNDCEEIHLNGKAEPAAGHCYQAAESIIPGQENVGEHPVPVDDACENCADAEEIQAFSADYLRGFAQDSESDAVADESAGPSRPVSGCDFEEGQVLELDEGYTQAASAILTSGNAGPGSGEPLEHIWEPLQHSAAEPLPDAGSVVPPDSPAEAHVSVDELPAYSFSESAQDFGSDVFEEVAGPDESEVLSYSENLNGSDAAYAQSEPPGDLLSEPELLAGPEPDDMMEPELILDGDSADEAFAAQAAEAGEAGRPEVEDEDFWPLEIPEPEVALPAGDTAMVRSESRAIVPMGMIPPMMTTLPENVRDEFRRLRSTLLLAAENSELQILMVCGVEAGDGASFVTQNLSLLLAEFDRINVARFELTGQTSPTREPGSADGENYQLRLCRTELANLRDIATAEGTVSLHELLRTCDTRKMMERLRRRFDFVMIDAPAITGNPDTALLASQVDGVILVAQQDETSCEALADAQNALQNARANVLGVVLNRRR